MTELHCMNMYTRVQCIYVHIKPKGWNWMGGRKGNAVIIIITNVPDNIGIIINMMEETYLYISTESNPIQKLCRKSLLSSPLSSPLDICSRYPFLGNIVCCERKSNEMSKLNRHKYIFAHFLWRVILYLHCKVALGTKSKLWKVSLKCFDKYKNYYSCPVHIYHSLASFIIHPIMTTVFVACKGCKLINY